MKRGFHRYAFKDGFFIGSARLVARLMLRSLSRNDKRVVCSVAAKKSLLHELEPYAMRPFKRAANFTKIQTSSDILYVITSDQARRAK
jgi:hypothetical protein